MNLEFGDRSTQLAEDSVNTASPVPRFHLLDALRGWAMLLGIVLHAAWFMSTRYFDTPITDADGSYVYEYVLCVIHMFRLQVFFVMAGFFGHLVFSKRGQARFIWHRLSRIGIPLVVGWLLLYPIMMLHYTWGGMISGRILSDQGLWVTLGNEIATAIKINPAMIHLWFLYDLLVIYALTLLVRLVFQRGIDRRSKLRHLVDRVFRWLMRSPWTVLLLAIPSAVLLYFEQWWWGIGGYPVWFVPEWPGLLGYWLFFYVGWLLFRQWNLLVECDRRWRTNVALGFALSVPLFAASTYADLRGTPLYPLLTPIEIGDHASLLPAAEHQASGQSTARQHIWRNLASRYQRFLVSHADLTSDQKAGLTLELNTNVISNPDFYEPRIWKSIPLPGDVVAMLESGLANDPSRISRLNRRLLELALPAMIAKNASDRLAARLGKALYGAAYAVAMWALVFGLIGAFNSLVSNPSPTSRYIADSSYWVYLIHLPILFQIEVLIADSKWGLGGVPKFLFYNIMATVLCFASYHYLVRSTLIGRVLNGRRYPFVSWFGRRSTAEAALGDSVLAPTVSLVPKTAGTTKKALRKQHS